MVCLNGCKDEVDDLLGYWAGTQQSSDGNTTYYLNITFSEDGVGELVYQGKHLNDNVAEFAYKLSGGKVRCEGLYYAWDGTVEVFDMTLRKSGHTLESIEGAFKGFKLTKQ